MQEDTINFEKETTSVEVGGQQLTFETGKMARQANGAVCLKVGDNVIFATACAKPDASEEVDFFPLRIDYQEKFSSSGKTLSGFIKREGRPTQRETLMCRLIDRPLRPLFPKGYYNEVQVITSLLSYDGENSPDPFAICAASAALMVSDIPFTKPIAAVRVGFVDGTFIINPNVTQQLESKLDLLLAGTEDAILMIEGYCDFLTEEQVITAIETGHKEIQKVCKTLFSWHQAIGKEKKFDSIAPIADEVFNQIKGILKERLAEAIAIKEKQPRELAMSQLKEEVFAQLEESEFPKRDIALGFKKLASEAMRKMVLETNVRPDGRAPNQVRPIHIEQSILPRTHGSSLFTRGETQSLAVCTIGGLNMVQRFETVHEAGQEKFYLQYSFPPFSVGEAGRMGPPGRREVGHGMLAQRALMPAIPDDEQFPYVIRLESNILESNGSSSMASVCGGSLALMDAGVPLKKPISGIAMGLILEEDQCVILSDISGTEDALGDMDFKITGDETGITAFQMDIKVEGITHEIMAKALMQAKEGREHILSKMNQACPKPREELSKYAPRIVIIKVKPSKIGTIIGPGGKQIRAIVDETGVDLDIDDDGIVNISGVDPEGVKRAKEIVESLVAEVEVGQTYNGKIVSIVAFGVFVEIIPGQEGLCHISELSHERVEDIGALFKEGQELTVKVLDINDRGQFKLSHKATLTKKV
jgi:polyribonucleotide nucleotidyltransferase